MNGNKIICIFDLVLRSRYTKNEYPKVAAIKFKSPQHVDKSTREGFFYITQRVNLGLS